MEDRKDLASISTAVIAVGLSLQSGILASTAVVIAIVTSIATVVDL